MGAEAAPPGPSAPLAGGGLGRPGVDRVEAPGSQADVARIRAELNRTRSDLDDSRRELEDIRAELAAERARADRDLAVMRRVQLGLMPACPPGPDGFELATAYRPARVVGGDFYDAYPLPPKDGIVGLAIADVTGKGITAALLMAFARAIMRSAAYNGSGPADALSRTNAVLTRDARTGLLLTAWMAELDGGTGVLRHAIAGHERPLWRHGRDGTVEELTGEGVLVGAFDDLGIEERAIALEPGDLVVAYTDGVTDARGPDGDRFGLYRLVDTLAAVGDAAASSALAAVVEAVEVFAAGGEAADDLTLLAIRRSPEIEREAGASGQDRPGPSSA